jgi:DnaK suppressor protein
VSSVVHWSDSRKRSRFTTAGGAAVTAIPLADFCLVLDELHASTASQLSVMNNTTGSAQIPDHLAGDAPSSDDNRSALVRRLAEIEAAKQRIADGSYGVCFGCGRLIPAGRLKAIPYTRYCLACEMRLRPHKSELDLDPRYLGWPRVEPTHPEKPETTTK